MKVRYIYSACVVLESEDVKICCDPWFTQGIYEGSWFHFPPLAADPLDVVGPVDAIYVSHIHPDHYDARFLKRYLERHPGTPLLIGKTDPPYLLNKMRADGFSPVVCERKTFGETEIAVFPNRLFEQDNIDTALVMKRGTESVVNLNDNPLDQEQVAEIQSFLGGTQPSVALLPYSGAGLYPQTYDFPTRKALLEAAARKRQTFLDGYARFVATLAPKRAVPFAGKYFLGGPLAALNEDRGVPDATEVLSLPGAECSLVLADGGAAVLDAATGVASAVRTTPYDPRQIREHLARQPFEGYDYEREIVPLHGRALPIPLLLRSAFRNARKAVKVSEPYWFCVRPHGWEKWAIFDVASDDGVKMSTDVAAITPRCEIFLDERLLFGLLSRMYHWNNADIGSHYRFRREPDVFRREVFRFLNHFQA